MDVAQAGLSFPRGFTGWAPRPFALCNVVQNPLLFSSDNAFEPVLGTPEEWQQNGCLDAKLVLHIGYLVGHSPGQLG